MIKDKIYDLLSLNEDAPIPMEILNEFSQAVVEGFRRQILTEKSEKSNLRLSQVGRCVRQQWYSIKGFDGEPLNPRTRMTFLFGDIIEAVVVALAKTAGVNLFDQQKEVKVLGVKGHIDGIIMDGKKACLFECKSMSDAGFKSLERNGLEDDFGYLTQANLYMHALGLDVGYLVAVNKNTGHIAEVEIHKDYDIINKALSNIKIVRKCLKKDTLPDRSFEATDEIFRNKPTGRKILPVQCAYCPYKEHCWDNITMEFKNNRPIWVVEDNNESNI